MKNLTFNNNVPGVSVNFYTKLNQLGFDAGDG